TTVAVVLALVLVGLRWKLGNAADPVFSTLAAIDAKAGTVMTPPPAAPAPAPRLAAFLKPEVDAGKVTVQDYADRSVVTIRGDGFFEPGSADIAGRVKPLLARIAEALNQTPGAVLVTGHTDNQPIRSLRFPSNWHLSQERATAVKSLLAATVAPARLRAEGRADSEPIESNADAAGRAKNRRVEITLQVPQNNG
ncbi:MAG: type VI secretion system protein TssL, long form, partial [Rhizobacter sp.]